MPPTVFPTGVTINLPDKSYDTLVVYDSGHRASALIDMNGNEVHSWTDVGHPAELVDPALTGGELGHVFGGKTSRPIYNDTVMELDWGGNVVWQWSDKAPGGKAGQHHDMARLANGNWMILSHLQQTIPGLFDDPVTCDILYEVSAAGEVVWSYNSGNHLADFGYNGENAELLTRRDLRGAIRTLMAFNTMQPVGGNKWFRGGDTRFHPENIIIGPDWRVWYIDQTRSFAGFKELRDPKRLVRCERGVWQKLQSLSDGEIEQRIKPYVPRYTKQLLIRRRLVVDHLRQRIASEGEDQVIFDWSQRAAGGDG